MKIFREIEFVDGRITEVPIDILFGHNINARYGPLMIAAAAVMAAGQIQAGRAAEAEGKSAQNIANYNAAVMEREAQAIKQKTQFEQRRQAQAGARTMSSMQAALSASGARTDVGTPLMLKAEQAKELELENLLIGYEGALESQRARSQATLDIMQGKIARERGRQAKRASYLKAGGTLLAGFAEAGEYGSPSYARGGVAGGGGRYGQNYFNYTTRP